MVFLINENLDIFYLKKSEFINENECDNNDNNKKNTRTEHY